MPTVHVRIADEANRPLPCRVHIGDAAGRSFAPFGLPATFPTGVNESLGPHSRIAKENWYSVDGSFEIDLPAGVPLRFRAIRGPAFVPLDETVTLVPGRMTVRFSMNRWTSPAWRSFDSRVHFARPHDAKRDAEAEDLNLVHLLVREHPAFSQDGHLYPVAENLSAFSGQGTLFGGDHDVAVNTFNVHPSLGRVGLLHSHRPVFPLTSGERDDDFTLDDWCDQGHRKGGVTVWADPFRPEAGLLGGEALIAAALGQIDAIELDPHPRTQPILPWIYRLWNAGLPLPLVAGSSRDANTIPVGAMRTYFDPAESWHTSVKAGRTFVTNGPLLAWSIADRSMTATAESVTPFDAMEIVHNGAIVATAAPSKRDDGLWHATLSGLGDWPESGWAAVRVRGTAPSLLYSPMPVFAHSSSVAIDVPGKPYSNRRAALPLLRQCVEDTLSWVEEYSRFTKPVAKKQFLDRTARVLLLFGREWP